MGQHAGAKKGKAAKTARAVLRQPAGWIWESVRNHWSGIIDWVPLGRNESENRI
jgi:hypothetical protein